MEAKAQLSHLIFKLYHLFAKSVFIAPDHVYLLINTIYNRYPLAFLFANRKYFYKRADGNPPSVRHSSVYLRLKK